MRLFHAACLALVAVLSSGCATTQYEWNNYDQRLLDFYKSASKSADFLRLMEEHLNDLERRGIRPPPGLYAEVGTFLLRRGDGKRAATFYAKEQAAWPESSSLMTALIKSIDAKSAGIDK